MKILFLTDNFPPERNAPAIRTFEHCRHWAAQGAQVTVITGAPNFPDGEVFEGYRNAWYRVEEMDGIKVVRVKTFIAANEGFVRRTLDYLSFMVSGFFGAIRQPRPDIVIGTSPQFFTAWAAYFAALVKRRPFVMEVRDLWPDSIVEVGVMREGVVIRVLRLLERFIYCRATLIVVVTHAFTRHIAAAGVDERRIILIRNGVDLDNFQQNGGNKEPPEAGKTQFRVGYIGTLGMAHALDKILEAAAIVARKDRAIRFSFTGSGAERRSLVEMAHRLGLGNVDFREPVARQYIPGEWARLDLGIVPLKNSQVFASVIPSKIFEGMASGTPLIMSLPPGEATELVEAAGAGISVPPEDPEQLAKAIISLRNDPEKREALGRAGRASAAQYDRRRQAELMMAEIRKPVAETTS